MLARSLTLLGIVLGPLQAPGALAAGHADLPVVKPVIGCEQLARVDLSDAAGERVIQSATVLQTPQGAFCKVGGELASGYSFEVNLPIERWTQRLVQSAQGNQSLPNAGSCAPATNGEFAIAVNSRGGSRRREGWQSDPAKRIAFAYELNHQTALIAKALIRAFYGQPQRYAYFLGCSGGGREVLIEAQRYPQDFDGVGVGAPAILISAHNGGFFHGWERIVNRAGDGSAILRRDRLPILHKAVVAHCAGVADARDGILQMPTACEFDPAWVRCPPQTTDRTNCLTPAEADVAKKLYRGATDAKGRGFDMSGFPPGSELAWPLTIPGNEPPSRTGSELRYLLSLPEGDQSAEALDAAFRFDDAWFEKIGVLAPLYNGANTNLQPFAARGGKVLLWQGAADTAVQQQSTIAYYQGVQKQLGAAATDRFMRLFLLPGVAHCGGGEGPAQIDVMSALMAWVESDHAPDMLVAAKTATQRSAIPGEVGQVQPNAAPRYPVAAVAQPASSIRPVFPFPAVARYDGKGDQDDPASFRPVASSVRIPQALNSRAEHMIGPDNQSSYQVIDGRLAVDRSRRAQR